MTHMAAIRVRLWLAAALPAMVAIVLLLVGFHQRQETALRLAMHGQGRAAASQLAGAAEFMLFVGDETGLQHLVDAAMAGSAQMRGAAVHGADGRRLVAAGQVSMPSGPLSDAVLAREDTHLWIAMPIHETALPMDDLFVASAQATVVAASPRVMGYAVIEMTLDTLRDQQQDLLVWALVTAGAGLLLAGLLSSTIASSVVRPIAHVVQVVSRIRQGHMTARADVQRSGVLQPLAQGINAMAQQVARTQDELRDQVAQATGELRRQKEAAERVARTDALTGIANRRAFTEHTEMEIERALRYGSPLSVIMIDLDHFKKINDRHGHAAGDEILTGFAATIALQIREVDLFARLGGEEFAVLLPNIRADEAAILAERMRASLATAGPVLDGQMLRYSASFGVAEFQPADRGAHRWMTRADAALYLAKTLGRDRVEVA